MPYRTSRRRFLLQTGQMGLGLSLLPLAACSGRRDATSELDDVALSALVSGLEADLPSLMAAARVPGLSIAIVHDARVVWNRGFGVKLSVSDAPVDADTRFEAGSVSKTVFAYAVMKLHEKGVLDLDTPLAEYVSER